MICGAVFAVRLKGAAHDFLHFQICGDKKCGGCFIWDRACHVTLPVSVGIQMFLSSVYKDGPAVCACFMHMNLPCPSEQLYICVCVCMCVCKIKKNLPNHEDPQRTGVV